LESLEILHDLKKRLIFLEEVNASNNNKLFEELKTVRSHLESDTSKAIHLIIQSHNSQNNIITELRQRLDSFQLHFETLERKMESMTNKMEEYQMKATKMEEPPEVEGISLEQYMNKGGQQPKKVNHDNKQTSRHIRKNKHTFDEFCDTAILEDELFAVENEVRAVINAYEKKSHEKADGEEDNNSDDDDKTEIDSFMTPPIQWN
jgi:uncharacterized coiled-coil protein SlyX